MGNCGTLCFSSRDSEYDPRRYEHRITPGNPYEYHPNHNSPHRQQSAAYNRNNEPEDLNVDQLPIRGSESDTQLSKALSQKSINKEKSNTLVEENERDRIKNDIRKEMAIEIGETIPDLYKNIEHLREGLRRNGLETCRLIIGLDFTSSNRDTGKYTFGGKNLHAVEPGKKNFYQQVMEILGETLGTFSVDGHVAAYYFGDLETHDVKVQAINIDQNGNEECSSITQLLERYTEIIPHVKLAGPTSFVPIIKKAIEIVKKRKEFHILVIIGDGAVTNLQENVDIVVEASKYPLSIVMVGVGDGDIPRYPDDPWFGMKQLDDAVKGRNFDNFQFVQYETDITAEEFVKNCLMEIPVQFKQCKELNYHV